MRRFNVSRPFLSCRRTVTPGTTFCLIPHRAARRLINVHSSPKFSFQRSKADAEKAPGSINSITEPRIN